MVSYVCSYRFMCLCYLLFGVVRFCLFVLNTNIFVSYVCIYFSYEFRLWCLFCFACGFVQVLLRRGCFFVLLSQSVLVLEPPGTSLSYGAAAACARFPTESYRLSARDRTMAPATALGFERPTNSKD